MTRRSRNLRKSIAALGCACLLGLAAPYAAARQYFDTPDAAMTAFGQAVRDNNETAMQGMLGADYRDVIPPVAPTSGAASTAPGPRRTASSKLASTR